MVKLVDTLDLGSSASRCEGSSPFARTIEEYKALLKQGFVFYRNCLFKDKALSIKLTHTHFINRDFSERYL